MEPKKFSVPPKFHLSLLIHAHQPVGNFEDVYERCYQRAYLPFIEHLQKHPAIRVALHYSGTLLLWIEKNHPKYFELLRSLVKSKQVEMVGGGLPPFIARPASRISSTTSRSWLTLIGKTPR